MNKLTINIKGQKVLVVMNPNRVTAYYLIGSMKLFIGKFDSLTQAVERI